MMDGCVWELCFRVGGLGLGAGSFVLIVFIKDTLYYTVCMYVCMCVWIEFGCWDRFHVMS